MQYAFSECLCALKNRDDIYGFEGSPLKAVQGAAIRDLTEGQFGPLNFGPSQSPRRRPADLSYSYSSPSPTSLSVSRVSFNTLNRHQYIIYLFINLSHRSQYRPSQSTFLTRGHLHKLTAVAPMMPLDRTRDHAKLSFLDSYS